MLRTYVLIALIFSFNFSYSQGDKNLYKQYRTGPDPDNFYHVWNYSFYGKLNILNSDQDYTKHSIGKGGGFLVQRLNSKTFGWSTGIEFNEINYRYEGVIENSIDKTNWLGIPISIRLYPSRRYFIELGFKFHYFLNAKNSIISNSETKSLKYPEEAFKNTFGAFITAQYQIWKRLNIGFQYQYLKGRNVNPSEIQPSIFNGFSFKVGAFIKNPSKRPN